MAVTRLCLFLKKIQHMKKTPFFLPLFIAITILMFTSCSSSRFYKDYQYTPREQAPDISGTEESSLEKAPEKEKVVITESPASYEKEITGSHRQTAENTQKMQQVVQAFKEEMVLQQDAPEKTTNREMMKKVTKRMVENGQISSLTAREEKKLDRAAAKMDKKLKKQGNEIDWRNNTPLELFFMIMAIAGLVLGIVGVSFGWFVFIVFAGIWLYFKLVVDNK
jgi:hypothetical protein